MMKQFIADGLAFTYPADWKLEQEDSAEGWTVTLQSPGTAFAVIQLDRDLPDPRQVVEEALGALREDYPNLEADSALENIAGEMALGHDIEFIHLDMLNSCRTRSFYGPAGTVFLLCQWSGADSEDFESSLDGIVKSVKSEE
ncbi:MAG: hypothetical protein U0840_00955 [Gemmataceae bacterium]